MRSALLLILFFFCQHCVAAPNVVVTIKPIHSLVAAIMEGVAKPQLLLPDQASPHTFQLKPSGLKELQQADLLIWVGPNLEQFLIKPLTQLHPSQGVITLSTIAKLQKLPLRHGRNWEHAEHDHHHDHENGTDPHFWLNTENAKIIVAFIADHLAKADPTHQAVYQQNATKLRAQMALLSTKLHTLLKPVHDQPFLVYHDGYQYFEKEFKLHAMGTIMLNPHLPLSANGLHTIQKLIQENKVNCVFLETEFQDNQIQRHLSTLGVRVAELDPLGARLKAGPENYFETMLQLGQTFAECLSAK